MSFEERLIDCVRRHNITFRRRGQKPQAWALTARELNSTVEACRTRWRSLRDTYRRHYKADNGSKEKWKYFKAMSFLSNYKHEPRYSSEPPDEEGDSNSLLTEMKSLKSGPVQDLNNSYDTYDSDEFFPPEETLPSSASEQTIAYDTVEATMSPVTVEASMSPVTVEASMSPLVEATSLYACPPPPPSAEKRPRRSRHRSDPVQQEMLKLLSLASDQLSSKPEKVSSTRKLLDSLATKIEEAQLPLIALNRLEVDLLTLVHTVLESSEGGG